MYTLVVTPPPATTGTIAVAIAAGAAADRAGNKSPAASRTQPFFMNGTPTDISLSGDSVPENAPAGRLVGTFSSADPNAGDTFTYTLVAGTGGGDNVAFRIEGNRLVANGPFNFEIRSSYSVRVRSTDSGGLSVEKPFTIRVTDVAEPLAVEAVVAAQRGSFRAGQVISFTLVLSRPATVTGSPRLPLLFGFTGRAATYAGGSGTNRLTFNYRIVAGDDAPQISVGRTLGLPAGSGIVSGAARLPAALPATVAAKVVPGLLIDTVAPRAVGTMVVPANGTYVAGARLQFTVVFSEAVFATGAKPVLGLTIGTGATAARQATLVSGSGTNRLVFEYVVKSGDVTPAGRGIQVAAALTGGPLADAAGNAAVSKVTVPSTQLVRVAAPAGAKAAAFATL